MDILESLTKGTTKEKEETQKEEKEEGAPEIILQEYVLEPSAPAEPGKKEEEEKKPTQESISKFGGPATMQKLYPGASMTPKPTLRRLSFASGRSQPLVIGICGGQSSGKTTLAKMIKDAIIGKVAILEQKRFYKQPFPVPAPNLTEEEQIKCINNIYKTHNFDCPEAVDWETFEKALTALMQGKTYRAPYFDENKKIRLDSHEELPAAKVIVVDGALILHNEAIRKKLNIKIFVDTDEDVRLSRRVLKYLDEFGITITLDEFLEVYFKFVKPGYEKYVEPSKKYAEIIIPNYGFSFIEARLGRMEISDSAMGLIVKQIESELSKM